MISSKKQVRVRIKIWRRLFSRLLIRVSSLTSLIPWRRAITRNLSILISLAIHRRKRRGLSRGPIRWNWLSRRGRTSRFSFRIRGILVRYPIWKVSLLGIKEQRIICRGSSNLTRGMTSCRKC